MGDFQVSLLEASALITVSALGGLARFVVLRIWVFQGGSRAAQPGTRVRRVRRQPRDVRRRMRHRIARVLVAAVLATMPLAGCGGEGSSTDCSLTQCTVTLDRLVRISHGGG